MPLQGSLKDFGLADIFSVIGTQNKTGTLAIVSRDERVTLFFSLGALVRSHATRRAHQDLLGALLVRAGVLAQDRLDAALAKQKISHKRLGLHLVEDGAVSQADLEEFARLQSTETVYRIFLWRGGNWTFSETDTPPEAMHPPVKSEFLLREAFRQADAWPLIRRKVVSYAMTWAKVVPDIDAVAAKGGKNSERMRAIGVPERKVFALVAPHRDVQTLIDLSRLGEFQTCLSLHALCEAGLVAVHAKTSVAPPREATVGAIGAPVQAAPPHSHPLMVTLCVVMAVATWILLLLGSGLSPWEADADQQTLFSDPALERTLGAGTTRRLHFRVQVHHALRGNYPAELSQTAGLSALSKAELHFPWQEAYFYQRHEQSYQLLPPLF